MTRLAQGLQITQNQPEIWPLDDRNDVIDLSCGHNEIGFGALTAEWLHCELQPP
jgi:hypothetical protein